MILEKTHWCEILLQKGFVPITSINRNDFLPYQSYMAFDDLSYSLLYAWSFRYSYMCRVILGNMVIVGHDIKDGLFFAILPANYETLYNTARAMIKVLSEFDLPFKMKYISPEMKKYLNDFEPDYDRSFSDYIYDVNDFIDIKGKRNRNKYREYRYAKNNFNTRYEKVTASNINDVQNIFDMWCAAHKCEDCVWGCEKEAFRGLMQVYDEKNCIGGIVYIDDAPASFGIAERLNDKFVCYHTQKNASRLRGLTYFLHYYMAMEHLDVPFINWGEDMGIEGLRTNKQKYHPCMMLDKYEIRF